MLLSRLGVIVVGAYGVHQATGVIKYSTVDESNLSSRCLLARSCSKLLRASGTGCIQWSAISAPFGSRSSSGYFIQPFGVIGGASSSFDRCDGFAARHNASKPATMNRGAPSGSHLSQVMGGCVATDTSQAIQPWAVAYFQLGFHSEGRPRTLFWLACHGPLPSDSYGLSRARGRANIENRWGGLFLN